MGDVLIFLLPFICTMQFGMFDGAQTVRRDAPDQAVFWHHSTEDWQGFSVQAFNESFRDSVRQGQTRYTPYDLWYLGGNHWYPPHKQFGLLLHPYTEGRTADFWHQHKSFWTWEISLVAASAAWSVHRAGGFKWYHFSYLTLHGVEGLSFNFFYKWVFRKDRRPLWDYIKGNVFSHPEY